VKYFIDINVIIDLLNNDEESKKQLKALFLEEGSELFINRLIVMETLRTIHFDHKKVFREAEKKLTLFRQVDIKPKIYKDAIAFSRFCHSKGIKIKGKCEAIDFLHFITVKYYTLEIVSNDGDMPKLEDAYAKFLESLDA
jgi:predicted nucleic acid-binding protein